MCGVKWGTGRVTWVDAETPAAGRRHHVVRRHQAAMTSLVVIFLLGIVRLLETLSGLQARSACLLIGKNNDCN
jgi:hypothetical protein